MRLRDYLYDVKTCEVQDGCFSGTVLLKSECPIYAGHFPGMPITPGACLTRMAEELIAGDFPDLKLSFIRDIRFLSIVTPLQSIEITYKFVVSGDDYSPKRIDFSFNDGEVLSAKMSFMYE